MNGLKAIFLESRLTALTRLGEVTIYTLPLSMFRVEMGSLHFALL